MKKFILQLLICLCLASPCFAGPEIFLGAGGAAAAQTCTIGSGSNWVNDNDNDYWGATKQYVANTGAKSICTLEVYSDSPTNAYVEIYDSTDTSLLGTSDTLASDVGLKYHTIAFSTPAPVTGDFIIRFTGFSITVRTYSTDYGFFGTADANKNGYDSTWRNWDVRMKIWYMQ